MIDIPAAMRRQADSLEARILSLRSVREPVSKKTRMYSLWLEKQIEADAVERYQFALRRLADAKSCDECPEEFDTLVFEYHLLPKLRTLMSCKPLNHFIDTKVWEDQSFLAKELRAWLGYTEEHPDAQPIFL